MMEVSIQTARKNFILLRRVTGKRQWQFITCAKVGIHTVLKERQQDALIAVRYITPKEAACVGHANIIANPQTT